DEELTCPYSSTPSNTASAVYLKPVEVSPCRSSHLSQQANLPNCTLKLREALPTTTRSKNMRHVEWLIFLMLPVQAVGNYSAHHWAVGHLRPGVGACCGRVADGP